MGAWPRELSFEYEFLSQARPGRLPRGTGQLGRGKEVAIARRGGVLTTMDREPGRGDERPDVIAGKAVSLAAGHVAAFAGAAADVDANGVTGHWPASRCFQRMTTTTRRRISNSAPTAPLRRRATRNLYSPLPPAVAASVRFEYGLSPSSWGWG